MTTMRGLQEALMNSRSIIIPMTVDSAISKTVLPPRIVASYQKYKTLNYLSTEGRYADSNSLDDMEQRNVQWGNTLALGHGMVSAGLDWKQQNWFPRVLVMTL